MRFSFGKFTFTRSQIYLCVCATLYLVGAIFMLVNTFADSVWAFWVGLAIAVIATVFYVLMVFEDRKKMSYSDETKNNNGHEYIEKIGTTSDGTNNTIARTTNGTNSNIGDTKTGEGPKTTEKPKSGEGAPKSGVKKTTSKK